MSNLFGTDGVRGEYGKVISAKLAFEIGNALCQIKNSPKILIGRDTRPSGSVLSTAFSAGALQGGGSVWDVGIISTAGVSFLVKSQNFDFGVMVTASHNLANFNGIKIFDKNGKKLCESEERFVEEFLHNNSISNVPGKFYKQDFLLSKYKKHLLSCVPKKLSGLKICLDNCFGSAYKFASAIFKSLGAEIICLANQNCGEKINKNCGSLHPEKLVEKVLETKSDIGFAFDGDADRVVAVSNSGAVFDGDKLLYILALYMKQSGQLYANSIVGTSHTNSGIVSSLNRNKINLVRTDIGDKYVIDTMDKMNLVLGGEQSGHIIIKPYTETGDGVLTALKICEIVKTSSKTLDQLFDAKLIPQQNIDVYVTDKIKVINNEHLKNFISQIENTLAPAGRVLVRASGTENLIRIMIESQDTVQATLFAQQLKKLIETI